MISGVSKVGIEVQDQDRAKAFWVTTMGFELVQDAPYGEGRRWLEVRSPDKAITLVLGGRPRDRSGIPDAMPTSNVFFCCDDISQTYEELTALGVKFPQPPVKQFYGWWSMFEDSEGNRFAL